MSHLPLLRNIFTYAGVYGDEGFGINHLRFIKLGAVVMFYYGFGMLYHLNKISTESDMSLGEKFNCLLACSTYIMMSSNYILLYIKRHDHKAIFKAMQCFDSFGEPQNLAQKVKFLDRVCALVIAYCGIAPLALTFMGFLQYESCIQIRADSNRAIYCGFVIEVSYPFYEHTQFLHYLHMVFEVYTAFTVCFCGSQTLACSIAAVELIIVRLNHLKNFLRMVTDDDGVHEIQYGRLRTCIMYHIHIIDLAERVNYCYKMSITIVLLGYAVNVGCSMIAFFEEYSSISILNLVGWTFTVYLLCRSGQRLHDISLSIGDAAYGLDWMKAPKKLKMDIQFVIMRANKPLTYKCLWGLGDFLFETYMKIMSTAFKFTSLRTGVTQ